MVLMWGKSYSGGSRGGARGPRVPPLFSDQTEARGAEKGFGDCPPSLCLRVWMTAPLLISRSVSSTYLWAIKQNLVKGL